MLTLVGAQFLASGIGSAQVITFRSVAEVDAPLIYLRDFASLECSDPETAARLGSLCFGPALPPGYTRAIDTDLVKLRLAQAGLKPKEWSFLGEGTVKITREATTMTPETVRVAVEEFLRQGGTLGDLRVRLYSPSAPILVPGGDAEVRITGFVGPGAGLGYRLLKAEIVAGGSPWRTIPVHVKISRLENVLVAVQQLPAGTVLRAEDLSIAQREIGDFQSAPVSAAEQAIGKRLRLPLAPGATLLASMLECVPAVEKGRQVVLEVCSGGVVVRCPALALSDGQLGDTVSVLCAYGRQRTTGAVVAPGRVRVCSEGPTQEGESHAS